MYGWEKQELDHPIVERSVKCVDCGKVRVFKVPVREYKLLVRIGIGLPERCEECFRRTKVNG